MSVCTNVCGLQLVHIHCIHTLTHSNTSAKLLFIVSFGRENQLKTDSGRCITATTTAAEGVTTCDPVDPAVDEQKGKIQHVIEVE